MKPIKLKIFQLIQLLEKEDFLKVRKLLKSSFFVQNKNSLRLFEYLIKFLPKMDSEKLAKEIVYKKVFGQEKFSDTKYSNLCAKSVELLEDFLILKKIQADSYQKNKILLNIYTEKQAESLCRTTEFRLRKLMYENPNDPRKFSRIDDEKHYKKEFDFYSKKLDRLNPKKLKERLHIYNDALVTLENSYRISNILLRVRRQNLMGYLGEIDFQEPTIEYTENLYFEIYMLLDKLFKKNDLRVFLKVKKLFFSNYELFLDESKREIFQLLSNYLIRIQSRKTHLYTEELVNLFSEAVKRKLFIVNGEIAPFDFLNIIILTAPHNVKWATGFWEEFQEYLKIPQEKKSDIIRFGKSHLLNDSGKFREAFLLSFEKKFVLKSVEIMARLHEIRCGYEAFLRHNDFQDLYESRLIANYEYLKRSKLPPMKKSGAIHLASVLKKLVKRYLKNDFSKAAKDSLLAEIAGYKHLNSRPWLEEKIKETKQRAI